MHAPQLLQNRGGLNKGVQIAVIDIATERGQDVVLAKYLTPDILINNNGGPPFVEFESLSRSDLEKSLKMNMITPIRMIQRTFNSLVIEGFRWAIKLHPYP